MKKKTNGCKGDANRVGHVPVAERPVAQQRSTSAIKLNEADYNPYP